MFKRAAFLLLVAALATGCTTLKTPDDSVFVTIDLQVNPAKVDDFMAVMIPAALDTRAWDGCQLFDIYVDQENPGHVLFFEIWQSKEQQQSYLKWRADTNFNAQLAPFLVGGGGLKYYAKVDG